MQPKFNVSSWDKANIELLSFVCVLTMYQWKLCLYFIVRYTYRYVTARDIILCVRCFLPVSQSMSQSRPGMSFSVSCISYMSLSPCLCHSQGYHSLCQGFLPVSQSMSQSRPGMSFSVSRFLTCFSFHVSFTARDIILCAKVSYLFLSPCLSHGQGCHSLCQGFLPVSQSMSLSQPGISFFVSRFLTCLSVHVSVTARDVILCVKVSYLSLSPCLSHGQGCHSLCQGFLPVSQSMSLSPPGISFFVSRFLTCFLVHVSVTARDIILCVKVSYLFLSPCLCHSQGCHSLCQGFLPVSQSMSLSQPGMSFFVSRFLTCFLVHVSVTARDVILCAKVSHLFLSPCLYHSQGYHSLCQGFSPVSQSMSQSRPGMSFSVSRFLTCFSVHVSVTARDIILCVKVSYLFLSPCLSHGQGCHSLCQGFLLVSQSMSLSQPGISFSVSRFLTCFSVHVSVTARDVILCVKVSYLFLSPCLSHGQGCHSLCQGFLPVSQSMSLSQPGISFFVSRFLTCLSVHVSVTARDIILCVKVSYLFLSPCLSHGQGCHSLCQGFLPVSQSMSLSQPGISFSVSRFLTCLSVHVSVTARDVILCVKVSYLFLSPCLCHSHGYHSLYQGFTFVSQSMSLSQPGIYFLYNTNI